MVSFTAQEEEDIALLEGPSTMTIADSATAAMGPILDSIPTDGLKCDVVFDIIRSRLASEPELVAKIPFVIQFNITKNKVPMTVWSKFGWILESLS